MAISDDQPICVGNLKAVMNEYMNQQSGIAGTFINYSDNNGDYLLTKSDNIDFSYQRYGTCIFTFKDAGTYLIESISYYYTSPAGTSGSVTLPDGQQIYGAYVNDDNPTASLVSDLKIVIEAGGQLKLNRTNGFLNFSVRVSRIA